jgi:hypothetical protein
MQTLFIVIAASFTGGLLFIYLLPVLTCVAATLIRNNERLSIDQKERILAHLQPATTDNAHGDWALLGLYAISLVAEVFFLYIDSVGSARIILVGMFIMLFVRSFTRAFRIEQTPSQH